MIVHPPLLEVYTCTWILVKEIPQMHIPTDPARTIDSARSPALSAARNYFLYSGCILYFIFVY